MARKNNSSDKDQELNELIADYETAKKENKPLYLDGDQLADIADRYALSRRFDEAQEVISYGLELHPGHTDLMVEQAYLYLDTMKLQKAKKRIFWPLWRTVTAVAITTSKQSISITN